MAELIKKGALSEEIESLTVHVTGLRAGNGVLSKFMTEYRKSVLRVIDEQPTTTESEIRAMVLNEVLEKVNTMNLWDSRDKDMFRLVVEQLKEE